MQKTKRGLPLLAGAFFALALAWPASAGFAQDGYSPGRTNNLDNRLSQIENQIQTLSRSVYRGAPPPADAGIGMSGNALAGYEERLSGIEQQLRSLTGQVEEAMYKAQDAQNRLERLQADYDSRLQRLETGNSTGASYIAPARDVAPVATPPAADNGHTLGAITSSGGAVAGTPGALYESAFADVRNAQYDSAETKFVQFLAQYPSNTLAGNAQYWLGETYYVRGDYKKAAKTFAQGYQDHPKGRKAADSLLKLGLSLSKMGRRDDACLSLDQLRKEFPGDTVPASRRAVQEMKSLGCSG